MSIETISNRQGFFLISMHFVGSLVMIGADIAAKQDVWISVILSLILSIPMLYIYSKLLMLYPGKNLFDIALEVFGNIFGRILSLLFIWYAFHLGALVIRNFSEYINVVSLPETPQTMSIYFIGLLCIWMCKAGIEVLGRWSSFTIPLILFILIITIILSLTKAHFINLKPVMYEGIKPILYSSFSFLAFPFLETVIFTMLFNNIKNNDKMFRLFLTSAIMGGAAILCVLVRNVLVIGAEGVNQVYFPSMLAVKTITVGIFIQRIELVVSIVFIFGAFVKISVCLLATSIGVSKILKIDNYRNIVAPLGLLMMSLALIVYDNLMEMFNWANNIYQYYAIPFQFILPIVLLIGAKIKIKLQAKKQKKISSG